MVAFTARFALTDEGWALVTGAVAYTEFDIPRGLLYDLYKGGSRAGYILYEM